MTFFLFAILGAVLGIFWHLLFGRRTGINMVADIMIGLVGAVSGGALTAFPDLLARLWSDYGMPMYVTENGAAYDDVVDADGQVHDHDRVQYLSEHYAAVHDAITDGADVRGHYVWSLLDNFEWSYGYSKRFGIVRVDFDTQLRTPKDSAHFYREIARSNAVPAL